MTIAAPIPINMNNMLQTIGNTYDGGVRAGFESASKVFMLFRVKKAENPPTANANRMFTMNVLILFHFML